MTCSKLHQHMIKSNGLDILAQINIYLVLSLIILSPILQIAPYNLRNASSNLPFLLPNMTISSTYGNTCRDF